MLSVSGAPTTTPHAPPTDEQLGSHTEAEHDTVKIFCPRCGEAYVPPNQSTTVDGAYFGPTFPHLFFMTFDDEVPRSPPERFVPRIYGFRIHSSSAGICCGGSTTNCCRRTRATTSP